MDIKVKMETTKMKTKYISCSKFCFRYFTLHCFFGLTFIFCKARRISHFTENKLHMILPRGKKLRLDSTLSMYRMRMSKNYAKTCCKWVYAKVYLIDV